MEISGSTDSINTKVSTWLDSASNIERISSPRNNITKENLHQVQPIDTDQIANNTKNNTKIEENYTYDNPSSSPRRPSIVLNNPEGNITYLLKPPKPPRGSSSHSEVSARKEIFNVSPTIPEETSYSDLEDPNVSQTIIANKTSNRVALHAIPMLKGWVRQWKLQTSQTAEDSTQKSATLQKEIRSFIPNDTLRVINKEAIQIVEEVCRVYRWEFGSTHRLTILAESHLKQLQLNLSTGYDG